MKKILLCSLLSLFSLALVSCEDPVDTSSNASSADSDSSYANNDSTPVEDEEDYTIVTSDNELTVEEDTYTFSIVAPNETYSSTYNPTINVSAGNTWSTSVTAINSNYTRIVTSDESVLPTSAVTLASTNDSASGGSNFITGFTLTIDRTQINVGSSYLKVEVMPNNGISSIIQVTTICVLVNVVEYGAIEVPTYNINLEINLDLLEMYLPMLYESITFYLVDSSNYKDVYGYSADYRIIQTIEEKISYFDTDKIEITNFKIAYENTYRMYIFVETSTFSDRRWIYFSGSGTGYTLTEDTSQSLLTVTQDNVTVTASIAGMYTLS